jgi:hypothetical protein
VFRFVLHVHFDDVGLLSGIVQAPERRGEYDYEAKGRQKLAGHRQLNHGQGSQGGSICKPGRLFTAFGVGVDESCIEKPRAGFIKV